MEAELISTLEMARRSGVSLRRLDLWVHKGYLTPAVTSSGTGRPRRWYEWQVGEVIEVREAHRPFDRLTERK